MKMKLTELRRIIKDVILEISEVDEEYYENTALPGDTVKKKIIAEPELGKQKQRDEYVDSKQKKRTKKVNLRSAEETEESMGDEANMVGGGGAGGGQIRGHAGGAWGKREKPKKLKSKNAMSISKALDEYDE